VKRGKVGSGYSVQVIGQKMPSHHGKEWVQGSWKLSRSR